MIVDCGTCTVRGAACADCVVTFLTIPVRAAPGPPSGSPGPAGAPGAAGEGAGGGSTAAAVDLDAAERDAIDVLARSGLVPPLRLVRAV